MSTPSLTTSPSELHIVTFRRPLVAPASDGVVVDLTGSGIPMLWAYASESTQTRGENDPFSLPHTAFGSFRSIDLFAEHARSSAFIGDRIPSRDTAETSGIRNTNGITRARNTEKLSSKRRRYIMFRDLHGSFLYLGTFFFFPIGFFITKVAPCLIQ